ncbi:hypothetical protein CHU98_g8435 [Xylaria longipes]|nr:hypothetical protein CHU98_g8435 [Xylaria longipes]
MRTCTSSVLKSALISIQSWLDADPGSIHYLLEMELDSVKCCKTFVAAIEGSVRDVHNATAIGDLSLKGNAKLGTLECFDGRSPANARQKSFVEAPGTQKALEQTKSDSASLLQVAHGSYRASRRFHGEVLGLRDTESYCSQATTQFTQTSSKLSMVFDFDKELFSTKVYGLLHRATVNNSIKQKRSQNLDQSTRLSERMVQNWRGKASVLLLGNTTKCDEFYESMASDYGQPLNPHAEIDVPSLLLQAMRQLLKEAGNFGKRLNIIQPWAEDYSYAGVMKQIEYYLACLNDIITLPDILPMITADMRTIASGGELSLQKMLAYDTGSIREYTSQRKENAIIYHFINTNHLAPSMERWLNSGAIHILPYVIELEAYSEGTKTLVDDISDFAALAVQQGQVKMLLLSNLAAFAAKLESSPSTEPIQTTTGKTLLMTPFDT